ncbi:MAG: ArgE/DapE family deacylase [Methanothrix sp.]|nr:ArgE/DapE family deacylase [Methanothrix sp.]MCX8207882.1 ArgE/DapE family deacylase [Methanothrix sp.]
MSAADEMFDSGYMLDLLRDLVAFRTVAPPGSFYHEIVDYLAPLLREMGFATKKLVMPADVFESKCSDPRLSGDRVNLIADMDLGRPEWLVIYTHLDVVPPGDGWSTDPFSLTIRDGRAYGRGVSDSKGAVAALIAALRGILVNRKPKYNLRLLLTTDEEVGGYSGLCYLADSGLVRGDKMLCMDGFSDDVVIGSNGIITWEVTVTGRAVHSGSSFLGDNAIEKSLPVIDAILRHKREVEKKRSSLPASSVLRDKGIDRMMAILNINVIHGGIKENIVPDRCVFRGDRRVIPEERMEDAMSELEEIVKRFGSDVSMRMWPGYPPMRIDPEHPWVIEVREAVRRATGSEPQLSGAQGSLDQAYATEITKIPAAVYGVGRQLESNAHGIDENVRVEDLVSYMRFIGELLL